MGKYKLGALDSKGRNQAGSEVIEKMYPGKYVEVAVMEVEKYANDNNLYFTKEGKLKK